MNKKMIIILVIVAAILLLSTLVLLLVAQRSTAPAVITDTANPTSITDNSTSDNSPVTSDNSNTLPSNSNTAVPVDSKTSLYQTARFFTERYGSYSTDNEHENIDSLRTFMTDAMQTTADALIASQTNTNTFYGITTQAANVDILDYTSTATGATVEVVARRTETTNGTTTQYTQTARLQFKKINEAWKVDTFKWQKI